MDFEKLLIKHPQLFLPEYLTQAARRKYIYRQGDESIYLYFLTKGITKICTINEDGDENLLAFFIAPEIVGIQNIFKAHPSQRAQISIIAESPCQYYKVPYEALSAYAYRQPEIFELLLEALGRQCRAFRSHVEYMQRGQTANTFCKLLLDIAEESPEGLLTIDKGFTYTDLANYLMVNIATISRIVKALKAENLLGVHQGQMTLLDADGLRRYADGEKMNY